MTVKSPQGIRDVSFECMANMFGCASPTGFGVFDFSNGQLISQINTTKMNEFPEGVQLISTLSSSNIVAVKPYGEKIQKIFIFDRKTQEVLNSMNIEREVTNVKLRPDYIIVATTKNIQIRALSDFSIIKNFDTSFNRDGIMSTPGSYVNTLLAFPSPDVGVICVADCFDVQRPKYVHAFKTPINFIQFNDTGRMLAVCGDNLKTVNIYGLPALNLIATLKIATSAKRICSLAFDTHGTQISVSFDNGNINIFDINQTAEDEIHKPVYKLKDPSGSNTWITFSSKTLKLGGVNAAGSAFRIVFNQEEKTASFDMFEQKIQFK